MNKTSSTLRSSLSRSTSVSFILLAIASASGCTPSFGPLQSSLNSSSSVSPDPTTPLPTTPVQTAPGFGTYLKLFAADSLWNMYPVSPSLTTIGIPDDSYYPDVAEGIYSTGVFEALTSDPAVTVYPQTGASGISVPDIGGDMPLVTIPHWPASVVAATGSDGHADIVDASTGLIYSFWQLKSVNGVWRAALMSAAPLKGRGFGDPARFYQGARAAGVPASAGLIRKHEYTDGDTMYRHALAMSMTKSGLSASPAYVFPATSADNNASTTNSGQVPEGALMMLPPNFDLKRLTFPDTLKVARTLMRYGARVVDRNEGTPYVIYVENGTGYVGGGKGWNSAYENELVVIKNALRMVSSVSSYSDASGGLHTVSTVGTGLSLVSLRGPWSLNSGPVLGNYNTFTQQIEWGATSSAVSVQTNANGNGYGVVSWAGFVSGQSYTFSATGAGGAKIRLEVHDPKTYATLFSTGDLSNGMSTTFNWPSGAYIVPVATSGANVASSAIGCQLVRNP